MKLAPPQEPVSAQVAPAPRSADDAVGGAPAVTVVIPTRERPELLRRAVRAVLAQDYSGPLECIVVFDQSDPLTLDPPDRPDRSLRTVSNTRTPGLAGARNTGILAAGGALVAFCDDDDEWLPSKLSRQVEVMAATGAEVVSCAITVRYRDAAIVRHAPSRPVRFEDLLRDRIVALHPSTVLCDLALLRQQIGLVDEQIPAGYAEDYDWLLRAARTSPIVSVPTPLVDVHWHATSFFTQRWRSISAALRYLIEKYPDIEHERVGYARIAGQIAFASAAAGERGQATRWAGRALRASWRERRAYLALAVAARLITAETVVRAAQSRGRGI